MRLRLHAVVALALCATVVGPLPSGVAPSEARPLAQPAHQTVAFAAPPVRVQVTEAPRVRPPTPPKDLRPTLVPGVRAHGVHVNGPPMLRPSEIDGVLAAARARARTAMSRAPSASASSGARRAQSLPSDPTASGTGINHWWRYQEQNVPGGGHLMVNVGTGNLVLQDDDMAVAHKGLALAFRRTYNSQMPAVVTGATVNWTSLYGTGWTNTFDAHLVRTSAGHNSVYDIDGARYDYVINDPNNPMAGYHTTTPGQYAILASDGACGFLWTKKSGTTYYFYNGQDFASCPALSPIGGYAGRLYQIVGRNRNTSITLSYSWDNGDASVNGKVSGITATTESGLAATLTFADFNGHRALQQLTYPDGATKVVYGYDANGNLGSVLRPSNNAQGAQPLQTYSYGAFGTDWLLVDLSSPRYNASCIAGNCGSDGGALLFGYAGTSAVSSTLNYIEHVAVVNPTISDGSSSSTLQAGYPSTAYGYLTEYYSTGVPTPTYGDTDGHLTNWVVDGTGRPTQTQECTLSTNRGQQCTDNQHWLVTNEAWDANNNLVSETDARGNESDYAYDVDGNTVAAAAPAPVPGGSRSTRLFTYDLHDNVTAYCDPNATHGIGADWTSTPTAPVPGQGGLCPQSTVAQQYQWSATTAEPFGELTATISPATATAPLGYQRTFYYDVGPQGGTDYGLPTRVVGASVTQSTDPTTPTRQPQQSFWYDGNGNLVCYGTGSGQWLLTYDALNRLTSAADPDDSSSGSGVCAKSGAQPGWNTTSRTTYYADGTVSSKQSASQAANGISTAFAYDLDGNEQSETHYYGCLTVASCTKGVTTKWYDGADRLVEVQQPYDGSDMQAYPWSTRYIYDLSQAQVTPYRGIGLAGYGNLVSTQELLSGTVWAPSGSYAMSSGTWTDVRATSYDALDRPVSSYEAAFGAQPKLTNTYDGQGSAGLLTSVLLATNELKTLSYDNMGRQTHVGYLYDGGVTPAIDQGYDPDGHVTTRTTSVLGSETIAYDATGAVKSVTEPAALGGGTISYGYYADGLRSSAGYSDATQTYANALSYAYRTDGKRDRLTLGNGSAFTWSYTAAGRLQTQTDPLTGTTVQPDAYYQANKIQKPYYPATVTYAPWTQSFDTYGRVATITLPVSLFAYTGSQFDLEDGVAQHTVSAYVPPNAPAFAPTQLTCLQSTIRNEKRPLTPFYTTSCSGATGPSQIDGAQLVLSPIRAQSLPGWTLDARAGMLLHNTASLGSDTIGSSYAYDSSGRLNQDFEGASEAVTTTGSPTFTQAWCPVGFIGTSQYPSRIVCYSDGSRSKTYDAENRLRTETFSYEPENTTTGGPTYTTTSYGFAEYGAYWEDTSGYQQPANIQAVDYGATSHPMRFSLYHPDLAGIPNYSPNETRAWLWDGDDRFLECQLVNGACQSPTLSIEGLGDYDPVHATFIRVNDRNRNGQVVIDRNTSGFSGWSDFPAHGQHGIYAPCSTGNADLPASQAGLCAKQHDGKLTADGWTLDYETWQGVRTFDQGVGQWNSPDAYAGNVHDPMGQKPFMWNRNNSYEYSDPTGYDALIMVDPRSVYPLGHVSMVIYDPHTMAGKRYESGPVHEGSVVHAPEKITIETIRDVRTLGNYNQDTYHYASTAAQDKAMTKFWNDTKAAADAGTDLYNAFDNNCDQKVGGAIAAAGLDSRPFSAGVPTVTGKILESSGLKVRPKDLKPKAK